MEQLCAPSCEVSLQGLQGRAGHKVPKVLKVHSGLLDLLEIGAPQARLVLAAELAERDSWVPLVLSESKVQVDRRDQSETQGQLGQ